MLMKPPLPGGRAKSLRLLSINQKRGCADAIRYSDEEIGSTWGKLPDREHLRKYVKGEPDTLKGVRPVLRGGVG